MKKRILGVLAAVALVIFGVASPASAASGYYQHGCTNPYYSGEHATATFYYTGRDSLHAGTVYKVYVSWGLGTAYSAKAMEYNGSTLVEQGFSSPTTFNTDIPFNNVNIYMVWHDSNGDINTCTIWA